MRRPSATTKPCFLSTMIPSPSRTSRGIQVYSLPVSTSVSGNDRAGPRRSRFWISIVVRTSPMSSTVTPPSGALTSFDCSRCQIYRLLWRSECGYEDASQACSRYSHERSPAVPPTPRASLLPHRIPVAAQLSRQHPLHALRLRVGQGIELGVQIGPQPHAITPHVVIVLHAVLVALEPRLGVEPRHPHIQRRLAGVMTGIGGAELGVLDHV